MASLKTALGGVKRRALNRERLIEWPPQARERPQDRVPLDDRPAYPKRLRTCSITHLSLATTGMPSAASNSGIASSEWMPITTRPRSLYFSAALGGKCWR